MTREGEDFRAAAGERVAADPPLNRRERRRRRFTPGDVAEVARQPQHRRAIMNGARRFRGTAR